MSTPCLAARLPRFAGFVAVVAVLTGCGVTGSSSGSSGDLNIIGFSVAKVAYDELGTAFAATLAGAGAHLFGSYGASGAQSRAVIAGQKADVVAFSLTPDMTGVVEAGLVADSWDSGPSKGMASDSVVVIAFRNGNPKGIRGWADLIKPGVRIVTADPGASGSAKWNLLAAYAQALGPKGDNVAAKAYLTAFIQHVVSWNASGRDATDVFSKGTGDVLISYENEVIAARAAGVELGYLVPNSTILIQNPAAVTKGAPPRASAFLSFVQSPAGQKILAGKGFRPVDPNLKVTGVTGANDPADPFPAVPDLIAIADLGGWTQADAMFFDKTSGLVTELRKG